MLLLVSRGQEDKSGGVNSTKSLQNVDTTVPSRDVISG